MINDNDMETSIRLRADGIHKHRSTTQSEEEQDVGRTKSSKYSVNTCRLTSSVKIAWPAPAAAPYMHVDTCVVDGFSFDKRTRA